VSPLDRNGDEVTLADVVDAPSTPEEEEELLALRPPVTTHVDPYRAVVGTTRADDLLVLVGNDGADVILTTNLPRDRVAGLLVRIAERLRASIS
jgi:hypothetical protein